MSFTNSLHTLITGKNALNHVHGHQVNGTINAGTVNFNAGQAVAKRTEYDEFEYIKRGHFTSVEDLGSIDLVNWDWKWRNGGPIVRRKARKTICTVEIIDRKSKFTAMFYEGKDAYRFWKNDLQRLSRIDNPGSFRLFGINQSAIPALIFHHELIPLGHIFTQSIWMGVYIQHLSINIGCKETALWIDTASGALFSGSDGPYFFLYKTAKRSIDVPRTVDMLKDSTSFLFSDFGSSVDNSVLACAYWTAKPTYLDDLFLVTTDHETEDPDHSAWTLATHPHICGLWRNPPYHLPMNDINELRFDTVYVPSLGAVARRPQGAGSLWFSWDRKGLVDHTVLDGGLTRFKFDPTHGGKVYLVTDCDWWKFWGEWLSQSCRVFAGLDVREGEEELFIIDPPGLRIRSTPRLAYKRLAAPFNSRYGKPLVEEIQPSPIYLFLRPFPMKISELVSWMNGHFYFWSFDETGQCEMSEEECGQWGFPVLTCTTWVQNGSANLISWPTSTYTALRDWQKARGFDPTTSDWARELGRPEWDIIGAEKSNISLRKLLTFKKTVGSSLWEAFAGSGISACGL
ncbi:hypothetical protein WG66_008060 [Moniliophthora roreri]|uniref:Uncharacterized protein n=1 Tax=Moniliophthora roreri TaxID=221103 RepID=A0A0W0EX75_MONRR|nr:hypothetical protein WG66_008060 [Moniliophthora roreri]